MTTDNVAEMTSGQLHDKLAQTRAELTQLRKQSTTPVQECGYCGYRYSAGIETSNFNVMAEHIKSCPAHPLAKALTELAQARTDLASAKEAADAWFDKLMQARAELAQRDRKHKNNAKMIEVRGKELGKVRTKLAQARAELAAVDESLGEFHCPVLDPKTEEPCGSFWEDHGVHLMKGALDHAEAALVLSAKALARQHDVKTEAGQLCSELKDLQGANRALTQQVADVTDNREFWYKKAQDAEAKTEGLERRLAGTEAQIAAIKEAVEWIWGFWDSNTLVARSSGYEEEIGAAWDKLLAASDAFSKSWESHGGNATKLLERLATLDATEAALADCGSRGIYTDFDGPADAIMQMAARIERLEDESMIEAETTGRDTTETTAPGRERIPERLTKADLAAHIRDLTQTVDAERRLRREAGEHIIERNVALGKTLDVTETPRAYKDGQMMTITERIFWLNSKLQHIAARWQRAKQRAKRAEAERDEISENLKRMVELNEWSRNELDRVGGRAEALAQLVTLGLPVLLTRLASCASAVAADYKGTPEGQMVAGDAKEARELAAKIKEALDDSQA